MSSKQKSSLTYEASLGACLSFAGQVLSTASPPVQVCTKEVLSPIVLEAHRFGQQVGKSCSSSTDKVSCVDPRKLLKKLQTYQSEPEWDRVGVQIDRLAFEDLTWDSQGNVAQTLEMELLELESRAAEANISVCVLLILRATTVDAKTSTLPESAILWFPLENHQDNNNGKKQYLLYACPGRIKVVKSGVDLLKKLRDEIKLMSDSDAVYSVWALSRAATSRGKKRPSVAAVAPASNQHRDVEVGTPRSDDVPEKARVMLKAESHEQVEEAGHGNCLQVDEAPNSHRAMSIRPVLNEDCVLPNTIFSFTKESTVRSQNCATPTTEHFVSIKSSNKATQMEEKEATLIAAELESSQQTVVSLLSQEDESPHSRPSATSRRLIISSSYSSGNPAIAKPTPKHEKRSELLWRSLDSDLEKPALLAKRAHPTAYAVDEVVALEEAEPMAPSAFSLSQSGSTPSAGSVVRDQGSRQPTPSVASEDPEDFGVVDQVLAPAEVKVSINDDDPNARTDLRKPMPARRNYKAKLGNRVWWELQCAAEKLLQEQCAAELAKPSNHASRTKNPSSSEGRAVKVVTSRSPSKDAKSHRKPYDFQIDSAISELQLSSSGPIPQPLPVKIDQIEENDITSAHQQELSVQDAKAEHKTSNQSTKLTASLLPRRELPRDEDNHGSFFTKTALFEHKTEESTSINNNNANKCQASPEKAPKSMRLEVLSHDEVSPSKSSVPAQSAHRKNSNKPATSPPCSDFYAKDTRDAPRVLVSRSSHEVVPAWHSGSHDVSRSCAAEDDDDNSVQNQWASTRTSYAVERERDQEAQMQSRFEPPAALKQAESKIRFGAQGRVPIRSNQHVQSKQQHSQFDGADSSSDDGNETVDQLKPTPRKLAQSAHKVNSSRAYRRFEDDDDDELKSVETKPREANRRPPHVATFITFEQDTKASSKKATSTATAQKQPVYSREEKLAELRQKKLSQLHKAREEQQHQQQQKKTSLLLQKTRSTLAAQRGVFDEHFAPTSTPGKATASGTTTTHLRAAKKLSNKKLVQNALEYTLLAGFSMEKERNAALQALAQSPCDNFIVLLKSSKDLKFRALYEHHTDRQEVARIFASAPNVPLLLMSDTIGQFFKYNSGKKEFAAIDSRAFTMKTDACALKDEIVFKKKAALGKLL